MIKKADHVKKRSTVENVSIAITEWVGTIQSIIVHTILFILCFSLYFLGVAFEQILLVLTTIVSLEAIYLSLFIQMTVTRNTESLEDVEDHPRMLLGNLALDGHAMVDRIDARLLIKSNAFGMRIGEQGLEIGMPV